MLTQQEQTVTMKGNPLTLTGNEVKVGDMAPDFTAVNVDMQEVKFSQAFKGKVCLLSSVPSLDTSVCSRETHRLSQEMQTLGDKAVFITVSMDLPFAQKRWCGAEGVTNTIALSDYRDAAFGKAYGLLIKELKLDARCVMVIDRDSKVRYRELVREISSEPDYEAAMRVVREIVNQ